ncbi:MAG: helix-turn-helix domain-containing protein [bacterium]|nr:helix-turn-helix domain-containing protein [bacterium]
MIRKERREDKVKLKECLILQAAVEVFADKGFHEAEISDIGQKAKVATGVIYCYFANKLDLLLTISVVGWKNCNSLLEKKLLKIEDPAEKLELFLKTLWHFFTADEAALSLAKILLTEELPPDDKVKEKALKKKVNLIKLHKANFFSVLRGIIREAQIRGLINKSMNDGAMAQIYYGAIRKLSLSIFDETLYGEPAGYDLQDVDIAIKKLVESFLV